MQDAGFGKEIRAYHKKREMQLSPHSPLLLLIIVNFLCLFTRILPHKKNGTRALFGNEVKKGTIGMKLWHRLGQGD